MRFDTPIYFQLVQRGAYDAETGNYGEDTIAEYKRFAAVNSTGINTLKLMYGEIKEGCLTVRLQRPYKEIFDRIRIGDKLYKVDTQQPLKDKTVFIVSEVQGDYTGEAGDGSLEYQKGYNDGLEQGYNNGYSTGYTEGEAKGFEAGSEQGYDNGYTDGFNSAPPDYLPCVTSLKIPNWNLLGKKEVVLNTQSITNYNGFMQQDKATMNTTVEHLTINGAMDGTITNIVMAFYCGTAEKTLKRLTLNCDLSKCTYMSYMCTYLTALEVVDGVPIDFSSVPSTGALFGGYNHGIREVRFVPLSIKCSISFSDDAYLSDETIQSIIDGLADLTGGASQKITWHSAVLAKLTIEQLDQITAKNWLFG